MRFLSTVFVLALAPLALGAGLTPSNDAALARNFGATARPFLQTYCVTCHGGDKPKADLDLGAYGSMGAVTNDLARWKLVLDRLTAGDMPPDEARLHPTAAQRKPVIDWINAVVAAETLRHAGDPGPVPARRLSNAEYDYSIRDLTGVDLRPTKEFPLDPANEAGFANSAESLAMSPALWKKYYLAARAVADNVVLQPVGFVFAPHPMLDDNDRDKYSILRIVDFYLRQPTDYAEYFLAAWSYQHRAELGRGPATLAEVAAEGKVSPKYLATVWAALNDPNEKVGPIAKLQILWHALPAPADTNPAALRARAGQMRDWVLNLRDQLVPVVAAPRGVGAQPAVLWMDRQMAANRRTYDPVRLKPGTPTVAPNLPDAGLTLLAVASANKAKAAIEGEATLVAHINPTPKVGERLAAGLGTPTAPVASKAADGRQLSALEIADLALAAQPERRAGGPLPKTPDIVKYGGVFLDAQVVTTASSVTAQLARAKKRGNQADPDLIVPADPVARAPYEAAFARFAGIFPDAFFISERARVLNDAETELSLEGRLLSAGLHAQTGYFRDDGPLQDLILDDTERHTLDQLWDTFNYNAEIAPRMHLAYLTTEGGAPHGAGFEAFRPENHDATSQAMIKKLTDLIYAQGGNVTVQLKEHLARTAADNLWLEQTRAAAEPTHLKSLLEFASRAWRRPLSAVERDGLLAFYHESREANGLGHEDAIRDCIVRVLMSPNFCYRIDLVEAAGGSAPTADHATTKVPQGFAHSVSLARAGSSPAPAASPAAPSDLPALPLSDYALASRLSYFVWSSLPDAGLLAHAAAGDLHRPEVLAAEARRMLQDARVLGLATEFAGNWLDFRQFEGHNAVDRERYPSFDSNLREAMFQEPLRFFVNLVQTGRPVQDFLYGDYTFVNAALAKHYGMTDAAPADNDTWVRVDHADRFGRGGLPPMAVFLTANSPGLRTSPVKRGYWVVRRLLGERIPPPPPNVPVLPADEKNLGDLTLRETLAKHRANPVCAGCHAKFDAFGLVFEGYGAIGERRDKDFAGHPVQTAADFPGGGTGSGLDGLRAELHAHREGQFVDNLAAKFLAYGLGRTLLLTDGPLLDEMKAKLAASGGRFDSLVTTIVTSPQFLTKRATATATAPAVAPAPALQATTDPMARTLAQPGSPLTGSASFVTRKS